MALDFSKPNNPNIPGINLVEAPNGRSWVWDGKKWELAKEAHLQFEADDPVKVGTFSSSTQGKTTIGIKHYLDVTDLDDLPEDTNP